MSEITETVEEIDGMNYYGVTLSVKEHSDDEIRIKLWKDNSTRHVRNSRLYYGSSYYDESVQWRCVMNDNRAVVDKALGLLNEEESDE